MKLNTKNFISVLVLGAAVFFLGFSTAKMVPGKSNQADAPSAQPTVETDREPEHVSVMIDFGDGERIYSATDIAWHEGDSVFDALKLYDDKASFGLKYKDYGGDLGVFVESIQGVQDPKKNAWWQYWVNNEYGTVGASVKKLRPGDVVMWKLTSAKQ